MRMKRENVKGLIRLKVNKKLLQQHIIECMQKVVTLKDISNIQGGIGMTSRLLCPN